MICVCLICYKLNKIYCEFLSKFTIYDVYIVVDDNDNNYIEYKKQYSVLNIIQINNNDCISKGFINMNFTIKKDITSWEKAIYYFSSINTKYNKVWFFEDDVFFYNEKSLLNIDLKYDNSDLLSREFNNTYISGSKNFWHWDKININLQPPYYRCMVCCVRISSKLLYKIKNYANTHNTLFFLEALFPTICKKNNMKFDTPIEFKNIIYKKTYNDKDIDKINLYHPIKDISKHKYYRDTIL